MTADEARTVIKALGEFVEARDRGDGLMMITFVKYDAGARSGKFHQYKHLSVDGLMMITFVNYDAGARSGKFHQYRHLSLPIAVYEEIKHELK